MENKRKVKIYIIIIYFKINFLKNNLIKKKFFKFI